MNVIHKKIYKIINKKIGYDETKNKSYKQKTSKRIN